MVTLLVVQAFDVQLEVRHGQSTSSTGRVLENKLKYVCVPAQWAVTGTVIVLLTVYCRTVVLTTVLTCSIARVILHVASMPVTVI